MFFLSPAAVVVIQLAELAELVVLELLLHELLQAELIP
jgi:hypothetical protein